MHDRVWRTKKGELIPVSKMETRHINNCIRLIKEYGWRKQYLERLELELTIRSLGDKK